MDTFYITKENGAKIPCVSDIPESCEKIVLIVHGIGSSKEGNSSLVYLDAFRKRNFGVFAYDQPGHGTDEAVKEELRLGACLESLKAAEHYLRAEYPKAEILYFASSFGGYILGLYLRKYPHAGKKAVLRSAAVIFPRMILGDPDAEPDPNTLKTLSKQGYLEVDLGADRPVRFTKGFFEDLGDPDNDLFRLYQEKKPDAELRFFHGEKDPVVPAAAVQAFAHAFGYPIMVFPGEEHSINQNPDSPVKLADSAAEFYNDEEEIQ